MSNSKDKDQSKKSLASQNEKWQLESAKIRKVQISLDFPDAADVLLRTLAAREHKAPSSMVREIVGMPSSPPKRARIGVSFNDSELEELGRRYQIDPNDKAEIRRRLTEEVTSVLSSAEVLSSSNSNERSDSNNSDGGVEEITASEKKNTDKNAKSLSLDSGSMKELKSVSDTIHQRFQQALAKRNLEDT